MRYRLSRISLRGLPRRISLRGVHLASGKVGVERSEKRKVKKGKDRSGTSAYSGELAELATMVNYWDCRGGVGVGVGVLELKKRRPSGAAAAGTAA